MVNLWKDLHNLAAAAAHGLLDAGAGAPGRPRGREWGGRREEGSGWGAQVYLWRIHFDVWQNQYNIVKFKNKIKLKKKSWT